MADDGLIAAYLRELRFSVARLADAEDIVAEAEDHLLEVVAELTASGRSAREAESEAIARFGSAALVSRTCITQAKQGVSVPTTRTRYAGLAAVIAPVLVLAGQWGNAATDRGSLHGLAVTMLTLSFPAFVFGLWGLRARHGGLGQLGRAALVLVLVAPPVSLVTAGWGAPFVFIPMVAIAQVVFAVEMLRASVLPVTPLALFAAGGGAALAEMVAAAAVTTAGGDAGHVSYLLALPLALTAAGFAWLGWHLWHEPAADQGGRLHPIAAGA
jgi:hypothetical protein